MQEKKTTTALTPETVIQRSPNQHAAEIYGEIIALNHENHNYYGITGIGVDIWNAIEKPKSMAALYEQLHREYDVDEERLLHDLYQFIRELAANGMIVTLSPDQQQVEENT